MPKRGWPSKVEPPKTILCILDPGQRRKTTYEQQKYSSNQ